MNIFLTSFCPKEAASHLDDLRLNKMILETAQLLCTAYRCLFDSTEPDMSILYKETHRNHPCSVWARAAIPHYVWLYHYFQAVSQEKYQRDCAHIGKKEVRYHASWVRLKDILCPTLQPNISLSAKDFTFNCTLFKEEADVRWAYQKYLAMKWTQDLRPPRWTATKAPFFWDPLSRTEQTQ